MITAQRGPDEAINKQLHQVTRYGHLIIALDLFHLHFYHTSMVPTYCIYILSFSSSTRRNSCHPCPTNCALSCILERYINSVCLGHINTTQPSTPPAEQLRIISHRLKCFVSPSTLDIFPPLKSHGLRPRRGTTHICRPNCTVVHAACPIFAAPK